MMGGGTLCYQGTNLAEEGWEERCVSNTERADKEPIWNSRKQGRGEEGGVEIG
jgi:hypothetical protein